MTGRSRLKDGVASLAYVPVIPSDSAMQCQWNRDRRDTPDDDGSGDHDGRNAPTTACRRTKTRQPGIAN